LILKNQTGLNGLSLCRKAPKNEYRRKEAKADKLKSNLVQM